MKIHKKMSNMEIAELLRAVASALQLKGASENKFRIIAYQRAADAIEHLSSEAKDVYDEGKLTEIAGIGESIASHLGEIFKSGKSKHFSSIMKDLPPSMFELTKLPGIGAKRAHKLATELKITSDKNAIKRLEKAAKQGRVSHLEGMGELTTEAIQKSIKEVKGRTNRLLLPYAEKIAFEVIEWLKKDKNNKRIDVLGSLRRKAATVGDVDIAVATTDLKGSLDRFTKYPNKSRVLERGSRTASIIIPGNRQVDLMVTDLDSYGSLLQHFTGSKHHNIALRDFAKKKGLSLSEYGINKTDTNKLTKFKKEDDFYKHLGLEWIPPELREDTGEIEAAKESKLPKLIQLKDIKSDLQIHSDFDIETSHDIGESSMLEIAQKAETLGYEYIAFTEHNPSKSGHNEAQIIDLIKRKKEAVSKIKSKVKTYNALEIDILPDGSLSVPEKGLLLLDFVTVSIHSSFKQDREKMTKRVIRALSYPNVKIFTHPTGRKIGHRESIELNWPEVFEICKKKDIWLEINADSMRLDLPSLLVRDAIKAGVKLTLGTDAHYKAGMDNMIYGIDVARRGWATKADIVNTRSLSEFEKMLNSKQ